MQIGIISVKCATRQLCFVVFRRDKNERTHGHNSSGEVSGSDKDDYDAGRPLSQRPSSSLQKSCELDSTKDYSHSGGRSEQSSEMTKLEQW